MRNDISFFLFFLGGVLFGWPLMSIFRYGLATYLFVAWLLFIVLIFIATNVCKREDGG
ncbi:MAG TPA: hypothetical protein VK654_09640 [Nitrospirota bacterium]|nr:hypothetical protein [Nitrospirota bacterium]